MQRHDPSGEEIPGEHPFHEGCGHGSREPVGEQFAAVAPQTWVVQFGLVCVLGRGFSLEWWGWGGCCGSLSRWWALVGKPWGVWRFSDRGSFSSRESIG